jgi:hypothetical protein
LAGVVFPIGLADANGGCGRRRSEGANDDRGLRRDRDARSEHAPWLASRNTRPPEDLDPVIDAIYDAAVAEGGWAEVMRRVTALTSARTGMLQVVDPVSATLFSLAAERLAPSPFALGSPRSGRLEGRSRGVAT